MAPALSGLGTARNLSIIKTKIVKNKIAARGGAIKMRNQSVETSAPQQLSPFVAATADLLVSMAFLRNRSCFVVPS
jgi:hypothetical protein